MLETPQGPQLTHLGQVLSRRSGGQMCFGKILGGREQLVGWGKPLPVLPSDRCLHSQDRGVLHK